MHEKVKVIKRDDKPPAPESASLADDDLRRLVIGLASLLKRRYPNDFRRIMAEIDQAKAA